MREKKGNLFWFLGILGCLVLLLVGLRVFSGVEYRTLDQNARNEAEGSYIELDQGMVHYYLEGADDDPLVVFIHGFSVPSYVWEPTTSFLNQNGYRTLRFDLFGRGFSDRPDLIYNITLFEAQMAGIVDILGLDSPFVVVGLSMGGPIAARYTHQHPEMVSGLVLISPIVIQSTKGDIFPLNVPGVGEYLMAAIMEPILLPKLQVNDFVNPGRFPEWEAKYKVQMHFEGTGKALLSTVRELVKVDPVLEYRELQDTGLPILLIWGEADETIGLDQIEVLTQILPDMNIRIVEDAGHLVHYERSEEVNSELIEFLDRNTR